MPDKQIIIADSTQLVNIAGVFRAPLLVMLDAEDIRRVKQHTWGMHGESTRTIRATINGKTVSLGKFLLNYEGPLTVDHKDRDLYNNTKVNLRVANKDEQARNKRPHGKSEYKGVGWHKRIGKFQARLMVEKKSIHIGYFDDEVEAAKAYDKLARKYHKEFAYLNFPVEEQN